MADMSMQGGATSANTGDDGSEDTLASVTISAMSDGTFTVSLTSGDAANSGGGDDQSDPSGMGAQGASTDASPDDPQSGAQAASDLQDALALAEQMLEQVLGDGADSSSGSAASDGQDSDQGSGQNADSDQLDPATASRYWRQLAARKKKIGNT